MLSVIARFVWAFARTLPVAMFATVYLALCARMVWAAMVVLFVALA